MDCARVMRGTFSRASSFTPRAWIAVSVSGVP